MDVKLIVFKKNDNKIFRLVQNLTKGEANFKQFMQFGNQLFIATEKHAREKNLSPVLLPTMSKDMDEQHKLSHKEVDFVDRSTKKICLTLLLYGVHKPP